MTYKELMAAIKRAMVEKNTDNKRILKMILEQAQKIAKLEKREVTDEDVEEAIEQVFKPLIKTLNSYIINDVTDEECEDIVAKFLETIPDKTNIGEAINLVINEFGDVIDGSRLKTTVEKILGR